MTEDNAVLTGSEPAAADPRAEVFDCALAYVDALYAAKFARTMNPHGEVPPVKEAQNRAIVASRALVAAVGRWREAQEGEEDEDADD